MMEKNTAKIWKQDSHEIVLKCQTIEQLSIECGWVEGGVGRTASG